MNTPKRLFQVSPGTTTSIAYTVPANMTVIMKNILMCNANAAASLTIYVVPAGQTLGGQHKIIGGYTVKANDTISVDIAAVLHAGDTVQVVQATANAITLYASGVEMV